MILANGNPQVLGYAIHMSVRFRLALGAVFLTLVVVLYFVVPREALTPETFRAFQAYLETWGFWAPLLFVLLYAGAAVFCIPGSLLTLAAGITFGLWKGFLVVFMGANLGASLSFAVGRALGQEGVKKILRGRLPRLEAGLERYGFDWVLGLRLFPGVPYFAFNYICGVSPVRWTDYFWGTLIGMIPGTFAFVSLGAALGTAASGVSLFDPAVWKRSDVWGPFAIVAGIVLLMKVLKLLRRKKD